MSSVIVFTGLPGTGKTTLSRTIAGSLAIPCYGKDDFKEIMYDTIGWSDTVFSSKLAQATFGIMDYITVQHLENNLPIILESNYSPKLASRTFKQWQARYDCTVIQIVCQTEIGALAERFFNRQQTSRHPGHMDTGTIDEHAASLAARIRNGEDQPLGITGPVRIIDTTDFSTVDTADLAQWIKRVLKAHHRQ